MMTFNPLDIRQNCRATAVTKLQSLSHPMPRRSHAPCCRYRNVCFPTSLDRGINDQCLTLAQTFRLSRRSKLRPLVREQETKKTGLITRQIAGEIDPNPTFAVDYSGRS